MRKKLFFGGTAYLGMPWNEQLKQLVFEGIEKYGINYGASRNNKTTPEVYRQAEAEAADRSGSEDAIIVSSGYLAAQLVVQYYLEGYKFLYAPDTHPALWIGKPSAPRITYGEWIEQVISEVNRSAVPVLIITNSLNNLFPQIYGFDWLNRIYSGRKVTLLVDDSHGIGITGETGEGVYSRIPKLPDIELIVIASMAKALGIDAGLILGEKKTIDQFRASVIYAGASPPPPGFMYAYAMGKDIYLQELERLRNNMLLFSELIDGIADLIFINNFPVYLIDDPSAERSLQESGITLSSFAYPDPAGEPLNRIVLNSTHRPDELRYLAATLRLMKGKG